MKTQLAIFDLDGTLLDTIDDLAAAADHALAVRSLPRHTTEAYRQMVGGGIRLLMRRALPEYLRTDEYIDRCLADFVDYYTENIDRRTRPYEGIEQLVAELSRRGVKMAVASNKFQAGTERLVGRFFPDAGFVAVSGNREGMPLKPDAAVVEQIIARAGVDRSGVVMIGDSGVDIATARNAEIRSIGVAWGFRSREELAAAGAGEIVSTAEELREAILG